MSEQPEQVGMPEDRRGTPDGMTSEDVESRSEMAQYLGIGAFPGDRDALLLKAHEMGAPDTVTDRLTSLPADEEFTNVQDVARALGLGTEHHRN